MDIIRATNLSKHFGQTRAVSGVDLTVKEGEVFGLIGPNGAGKTTLIQILTGLLDPTAGRAEVLGFDTVRDTEAIREQIGYLSQKFTLYGSLTVEENLDFFADLYLVPSDLREKRKEELLKWSRLEAFRTRQAAKLSGGMQKKLHLCSALIHKPKILFLDEPTTGVDPVSRRELWKILYDLVADGLTLFVSTPYMDEAERCHLVALMHQGKILRCDSPQALRLKLGETVLEVRTSPLLRAKEILQSPMFSSRAYTMGDRLHLLVPEAEPALPNIRAMLAAAGVQVESLRQVSATMEDVFLSIIAETDREKVAPERAGVEFGSEEHTERDGEAIRVQGLTKAFGGFVAVDSITFSIRRGEIFGFLGPNGSGKTTTIRMLCGLLLPTAGQAWVLGRDIVREPRGIKPRIGYMSQRFSLYEELTVEENLDFFSGGYRARSRSEQKAWALKMAGHKGLERRLVRELSGGVKQRLALGCALMHRPEILFLDEPTAGVDPASRREFWDMIGDLASHGTTVFVTTHYLDEAENCHRLGFIYRGRLLAIGGPQELKKKMRLGKMVEVECSDALKASRLLRSLTSISQIGVFGNRLHLLVDDLETTMPVIKHVLAREGISVGQFEEIPFALEDLFGIFVQMEEERITEAHA